MLKDQIIERLHEIRQPHLSTKLDLLNEKELEKFYQLLSPDLLRAQRAALKTSKIREEIEPILQAETASDTSTPLGIEQIVQGKVACLILAGGQGSRLGASVPKALVTVSPDGKKTLLDILLDKIIAAAQFHRVKIPCAIIVSETNQAMIADYIQEKTFGDFITLVVQNEAPILDEHENWVLRDDGKLATAPDGNGYALHLLEKNGVLKKWKASGIDVITIVPIENPLADPVDPILIGYHVSHPADVTIKVITRQNGEEKVGVIVRKNNHIEVREYSELPVSTSQKNCLANTGLFAVNLTFASQVAHHEFPLHVAHKQDPISKQWIWKFERFIFDMLPLSHQTNLLLYPREDVYAPLKNNDGLKAVQAALKRLM